MKRIAYNRNPLAEETHTNGVSYLRFPEFDAAGGVRHAFSTRQGGVSKGPYASMNLSFTRGDEDAAVRENYRLFAEVLDRKPEDVVCTFQTHTTNIRVVTKEDAGKGVVCERDYQDIDGLITDDASVVLTVFYADCVPLLFADPVKKVIGTAHAGWRGSVNGIGQKMIGTMRDVFGTKPEDLYVAIGPSICGTCYEVGEEVIDEVREKSPEEIRKRITHDLYEPDAPSGQVVFGLTKPAGGNRHLDLHLLNRLLLRDAGVPEDHLLVTDICTRCNPDRLFSFRIHGESRGNMAAFLRLAGE